MRRAQSAEKGRAGKAQDRRSAEWEKCMMWKAQDVEKAG